MEANWFSILPKDTSTCRVQRLGIVPPTLQLVLYFLSHTSCILVFTETKIQLVVNNDLLVKRALTRAVTAPTYNSPAGTKTTM